MLVKLKNIGQIKEAELSVGGLTVLCGENNTGKTYATYSTFCCLEAIQNYLPIVSIETLALEKLFESGSIEIDLSKYIESIDSMLNTAFSKFFPEHIHKMMAASEYLYQGAKVAVRIDRDEFARRLKSYRKKVTPVPSRSNQMEICKKQGSYNVTYPS